MSLLTLKSITINGFRSFKNKQVFQLDRPAGLYYVTGINKVQKRLGGNAVGKSSVVDSICWVLFGKTVRGLSGPKVKNWNSKSCKVILKFAIDSIDRVLTRTQTPNSITIEPGINQLETETVDQKTLDNFLGIDYEKFLYSVISGQFNQSFLDLQPTERLNLLTPVIDKLAIWDECAKKAGLDTSVYETAVSNLSMNKQSTLSTISALEAELTRLNTSNADFESSKQQKLHELVTILDNISSKLTLQKQEVSNLTKSLQRRQEDRQSLENDKTRIQDNLNNITETRNLYISDLATVQAKRSMAHSEFTTKWKTIKDCPYCYRPVEESVIQFNKKRLTIDILGFDKDIKFKQDQLNQLAERTNINKDKLNAVEQSIKDLNTKTQEVTKSLNDANKIYLTLEAEKDRYNTELINIRESTSPYLELIDICNSNIVQSKETLESTEAALKQAQSDVLGHQFWIKGFKELRLWLISDVLLALEIESNNVLAALGLESWALKFELERETTNGGITKGFHVLVKPPEFKDDDYVPFTTWSGGETARLRLAGTKGFSNLIKNFKGIDFNIEIYDEPTQFVNPEGIEDFLQFLADEAEEKQKVIYVIDHHSLSSDLFKKVITIEKDKNGSKVIG